MLSTQQVSVIIATYRRKEQLYKALVSVAEQTYRNLEIVLVDDNASKEWNETVSEIVIDFRTHFPQVSINYIVNSTNKGSAEARNIGIQHSKGEYVTFLDDDDIYLPNRIVKMHS